MKFETRYISCVSATFELSNKSIYFSETKYDVKVDGKIVLKDVNTNVFSIYNLEPNRDYVVSIDDYELKIHTLNVSLILHSKILRERLELRALLVPLAPLVLLDPLALLEPLAL